MKNRLTYISKSTLEKYPQFLIKDQEDVFLDGSVIKARLKDYSILSVLKTLHAVQMGGSLSFSNLYTASKIRMKVSFLSYLKLCVESGFLKKEVKNPNVMYSLTPKGEVFLSLFCDN